MLCNCFDRVEKIDVRGFGNFNPNISWVIDVYGHLPSFFFKDMYVCIYHIYYKGHCPILNQTHMSCSPTQAPEEE